MKYTQILLTILTIFTVEGIAAEPIKIAVVDTGIKSEYVNKVKLCKEGHYDFINNKPGIPEDVHGHGTNIVLTINDNIKIENYCIIVIKFYGKRKNKNGNVEESYKSFKHAINYKADIINFSGGGKLEGIKERNLINNNKEVLFVVSAGNSGNNLDQLCDYFPACYKLKNIISVGSVGDNGYRAKYSNYGASVDAWELGYSNAGGRYMQGTSQAAARHTARVVNNMAKNRKTNSQLYNIFPDINLIDLDN